MLYKVLKWMRRLMPTLLCCFCLLIPAEDANAEGIMELGVDGYDSLAYADTLSDGRILLCGAQSAPGSYKDSSARLLCLNADRTVSWEYLDTAADGGRFIYARELNDGTVGAVYCKLVDYGWQEDLAFRFFTPDGEPAGKKTVIPDPDSDGIQISGVAKTCLTAYMSGEVEEDEFLLDWDGSRIGPLEISASTPHHIEAAEGIIVVGFRDMSDDLTATYIAKVDSRGAMLWETELPAAWPQTSLPLNETVMQTEDGGYLVFEQMRAPSHRHGLYDFRSALVKLDADGNVLWTSMNGFEDSLDMAKGAALADGKGAACLFSYHENEMSERMNNPRTVIWFDEDGKSLGSAEMNLTPQDFTHLNGYIRQKPGREEWTPMLYAEEIIPMEDGMWMLANIALVKNPDIPVAVGESYDAVLIRLPEP